MARQELLNGETRLSFRTKLNSMFTELYNSITSIGVSITNLNASTITINSTLTAHDLRLTAVEGVNTAQDAYLAVLNNVGVTQVAALTPMPSVSVTTTPTKLDFFSSIPLQTGGTSVGDVPSQAVTIITSGVYKVAGNLILEFPQTDELSIRLYKNGSPVTPAFHQQGLGAGKPVNMGYTAVLPLVATDVLTLYVTSNTATFSCIVDGSSVLIEKTIY